MVLKITNLHILRYLPTCWLYLLERYTIDNQRCTHTASASNTTNSLLYSYIAWKTKTLTENHLNRGKTSCFRSHIFSCLLIITVFLSPCCPPVGFEGQNYVPKHILDIYNFKTVKLNYSKLLGFHRIGNIHKHITALIYNILQFKYIVAEVTANGIRLGMSKKYYHHYLLE